MTIKLGCEVNWHLAILCNHGSEGSAKSLVRTNAMSKGEDDALIVQISTDIANAVFMAEVTVVHVSQEEVSEIISSDDPWSSVQTVQGISTIHNILYM